MIAQDQTEIVEFLGNPRTHGIESGVERIETHISEVFLAGNRALKLKRAVKLPYVDFSTPELRLLACKREVELNRRTAPGLYLGTRTITRADDGTLSIDGNGRLADAAVEMIRFDSDTLFDRLAASGKLTADLMRQTADAIAAFHARAERINGIGGAEAMGRVLDINESGFATSHVFEERETSHFSKVFRGELAKHKKRLDRRGGEGRIVLGHGDLHLRNICLFEGQPTLFDCIEFNDAIATVDVLYDLAFLIMDLWHRDLAGFANIAANRYIDRSGDEDGFSLLPFFMAVRAAVRAHVTATQVEEGKKFDAGLAARARSYFDLALRLLEKGEPCLIAIGGLSGSGKSVLAEALAPKIATPPGARILESDHIRKGLFGVSPETRLPQEAYGEEVGRRVYGIIARRAVDLMSDGCTVIADAVYSDPAYRASIEDAARKFGVRFFGFWLEASPSVLESRVRSRRGSASDADTGVLLRQLKNVTPPQDWQHVDTAHPVERILETIMATLGRR